MIFLTLLDLLLNLDKHLGNLIAQYGGLVYGLLFAIIFCETGLVFTPFLPGDSLLFAAGTFAALGALELWRLWLLLLAAAVIGDSVNYWIGRKGGGWLVQRFDGRLIRRAHLEQAHRFYEKHGPKMVILARFVPIVRTFAPFISGLSRMSYAKFLAFDVLGGTLWVSLFVFGGFFFGNIPTVREHFSLVILAIVILSLVPMAYEIWRARRDKELQA